MTTDHGFGLCTHTDFDCSDKSCCETYGDCTQGRTCPIRTGVITKEQRAYMDAKLSVEYAGEEPEFADFDSCMKMAGRCVGYLAALVLVAGLAGFLWVRWAV